MFRYLQGSSKSGFLGEVSIDFADLAEGAKPVNLTLPLQTSKSGAVLHVSLSLHLLHAGTQYLHMHSHMHRNNLAATNHF